MTADTETAGALGHFDNTFMGGANRASGRQPDMVGIGVWADITTPQQWIKHVNSYSSTFGTGIPILYQRGSGVVGTIRLHSGAGAGLTLGQSVVGGFGTSCGSARK